MKKIVLAPSGSDGDIFPMLSFALALKKRNHDVLVCSLPNFEALFQANNIKFQVSGLDVKKWSKGKLPSFLQQIKFLQADVQMQFEVLEKATLGTDAIFSGGYNMAAASIAEHKKIKHTHVFHVPNVFPTDSHPCMMVPWQKMSKQLNEVSWVLNSINQNICFKKVVNENRKKLKLKPVKDIWEYFIKDSLMAIDPTLYDMPVEFKKNHAQTGYWYPIIDEDLPQDLKDFIEQAPNVFYFGFGSMPTSNKIKIMKSVQTVCQKLNLRAVVSKGWAEFEINDPNIFLAGKISHQKLFPLIKVAVHHGGPGTVSTAAKAGIPQIIVPHILDQFYWGEKLQQLGVAAKAISRNQFDAENLEASLTEILKNPTYLEKAKSLKTKLQNSDGINDFFNPEFQKRWGFDL